MSDLVHVFAWVTEVMVEHVVTRQISVTAVVTHVQVMEVMMEHVVARQISVTVVVTHVQDRRRHLPYACM
jgi:hypothetical protein